MTSQCPHGTPLTEDCGKCRAEVERMKEQVRVALSLGHTSVFPLAERKSDYGEVLDYAQPGLDKREWLAGLAMQAMVSLGVEGPGTLDLLATNSVKAADALLKELAK